MVDEPDKYLDFVLALAQLWASLPFDPSVHVDRNGHTKAYRPWQSRPAHWISRFYPLANRIDQAGPAHKVLAQDAPGHPDAASALQVVPIPQKAAPMHQHCSVRAWLRGWRRPVLWSTPWSAGAHVPPKLSWNFRPEAGPGGQLHDLEAPGGAIASRWSHSKQVAQIPGRAGTPGLSQHDNDEQQSVEHDPVVHL